MKKNNKGFTLVELIVVLVILAILAAILTPALLGYIDRARAEKDYSTAQTVRVAAQAAIDQAYGDGVKPDDGSTTVANIGAMTGTISGTVGGTMNKYQQLVFTLATVQTVSSNTGKGVYSYSFNYTNGIITGGNVVINGSTYKLDGGSWSVSNN
ncbi:MAG: type II secretion system protein [Lachnospiraceae bacterium]|nr:type II secretion system protein [Lachnospiraceae bacterium]